MVKKGVAGNVKPDAIVPPLNIYRGDAPDGIDVARFAFFAEGRKIPFTYQEFRYSPEIIDVQRFPHPHGAKHHEGSSRGMIINQVAVRALQRIEAGVEVVGNPIRIFNRHVSRKNPVQADAQLLKAYIAVRAEVNYLPERMHAGVCSSGRGNPYPVFAQYLKRSFKLTLYRSRVFLKLPSVETGTVILDFNSYFSGV
jgi:hypothetical protein